MEHEETADPAASIIRPANTGKNLFFFILIVLFMFILCCYFYLYNVAKAETLHGRIDGLTVINALAKKLKKFFYLEIYV